MLGGRGVEFELARRMSAGPGREPAAGRRRGDAAGPRMVGGVGADGWPGPGRSWTTTSAGAGVGLGRDHQRARPCAGSSRGSPGVVEMAAVIEELGPWWGQLSPLAVAHFVQRVIRVLQPAPRPRAGRGSRPRGAVPVVRPDRRLGGPVRGPAAVGGGGGDRRGRGLRGEASFRGRPRPGIGAAGRWTGGAGQRRPRVRVDPDPGWAARLRLGHHGLDSPRRPGVDDVPRAHPHSRGAAVHRLRCAGHPDRARRGAVPGHRRGVPRGRRGPVAGCRVPRARGPARGRPEPSAAARIAALATTLLGTRIPLAVGRTARTATPAQRRALAARDRGCIIPGCGIPAEACQTHHLEDWAAGGDTDLPNLALLCWAHHRQVDLGMWTIVPPRPRIGTPTGARSATRHALARQQRRTLDHHENTPNTLAAVRWRRLTGRPPSPASTTSTSPWSSSPGRPSSTCPSS